jgi:hypothetical protein
MKMTKYMLIIIAFLSALTAVNGQHGRDFDGKREKIKALKVAYITEKLQLTPEEAERFWPVYNEFDQKRHNLEIEISGQAIGKNPDIALMTDAEVDQLIRERLKREEQVLELKQEYFLKFKEVLTIKKVYRLYEAEMGFKKLLLERLQEGQRPEPGVGP